MFLVHFCQLPSTPDDANSIESLQSSSVVFGLSNFFLGFKLQGRANLRNIVPNYRRSGSLRASNLGKPRTNLGPRNNGGKQPCLERGFGRREKIQP